MSPCIGLIVTGEDTLKELAFFLHTLEIWHPDARIFIYTDSSTEPRIQKISFSGQIQCKVALDAYSGKNRRVMELLPGKLYNSLWKDYMYEKANVIDWMFSSQCEENGVWFMDADITFLAVLPSIPPHAELALSPHYIKERDTSRFGFYNAGFIWMKNPSYLSAWRKAGETSRFFEQSALETIADIAKEKQTLHEFPMQVNFGWWRMFQSSWSPQTIQSKFAIFRNSNSIGVQFDGYSLQSIHTHWDNKGEHALQEFNLWVRTFLLKFQKHRPIYKFLSIISPR